MVTIWTIIAGMMLANICWLGLLLVALISKKIRTWVFNLIDDITGVDEEEEECDVVED